MTKLMRYWLDSFHFDSRLYISEEPEDGQCANGRHAIGDRSFIVLQEQNKLNGPEDDKTEMNVGIYEVLFADGCLPYPPIQSI